MFVPFLLLVYRVKVENARFVGRKNDLYWVKVVASVWVDFRGTLLNKRTSETVHDTVLSVTLLTEAEQVLSHYLGPVFFEAISSGLEETLSFKLNFQLRLPWITTEIVNNHFISKRWIALIQLNRRGVWLNNHLTQFEVVLICAKSWGSKTSSPRIQVGLEFREATFLCNKVAWRVAWNTFWPSCRSSKVWALVELGESRLYSWWLAPNLMLNIGNSNLTLVWAHRMARALAS